MVQRILNSKEDARKRTRAMLVRHKYAALVAIFVMVACNVKGNVPIFGPV